MNVLHGDIIDANGAVAGSGGGGEPRREIIRLLRMLRRNWALIAGAALAFLVLGIVFTNVVDPSYRSTVRILLDQNRAGEVADAGTLPQGNNIDEYIATQVAIFQSDVIVRRVAAGLAADEEGNLRRLAEGETAPVPAPGEEGDLAVQPILDGLRRMTTVYRLDRSFVVEVSAISPDPTLARYVADAVGSAYISDQSDSYSQSLTQAGDWLEERIEDLRRQSLEAAEAVEDFRAQSGIRATEGQLISDQQLTGLSNQFVLAEANVSRLQSRYDTFGEAIESEDLVTLAGLLLGSSEADGGAQSGIAADYLNARERERAVAEAFGPDNVQLAAIRAEAERIGRLVVVESRGRLAFYGNELVAARAQLVGLEDSMQVAAARSETSNLPLVQLRSLEQRANSLQTLYQTYLQRYQETLQRQSLPLNAARIISYAEEATRPVFPNTKIVLAFSLVLGLGLGTAVAIGREFFDGSLRTTEDLKRLGLEPLGYAPRLRGSARSGTRAALELAKLRRSLVLALRTGREKGPLFVAFVSGSPGEGRTFMANLLATALVEDGGKAAIVDLTGENMPAAAPRRGWFGRKRPTGGEGGGASTTMPGLTCTAGKLADLRELSSRPRAFGRLGELAPYDIVVLDLPPLTSSAELRAVAEASDAIVVLAEWGRTEADTLREILTSGNLFQRKIAGAVLTKVHRRRRGHYEAKRGGLAG